MPALFGISEWTWIPKAAFHNDARVHPVLIAPRDEGRARRRAQCGRIEHVVSETIRGERFKGRRGNRAAEYAGSAKADIVGQDEQHIGRPFSAETGCGKSGLESLVVRPMTPLNSGSG